MQNPKAEIFRHLRPSWYNRKTHAIEPLTHGGVSFLLKPTAERTYDFWIYICPEDASFSARQAVKTLRDVEARGTVPWGVLTLTEDPIIEQLSKFIITEQHILPSEVGHQVLKIVMVNGYANWKFSSARDKYSESRKHYQSAAQCQTLPSTRSQSSQIQLDTIVEHGSSGNLQKE